MIIPRFSCAAVIWVVICGVPNNSQEVTICAQSIVKICSIDLNIQEMPPAIPMQFPDSEIKKQNDRTRWQAFRWNTEILHNSNVEIYV